MSHIPVLKDESIDGLLIKKGDIIFDCTLGGGGHTFSMIKQFGKDIKIIGLDLDIDAEKRTKDLISGYPSDFIFKNASFKDIDKVAKDLNISHVNGILLDLGISSFQLEVAGRGFSFLKNEPLLMTMKKNPKPEDLTAKDIVNIWSEESLADIIYGFGEEKYSRKIAKAIVLSRQQKEISTTFDLVEIIDGAVGKYYKKTKIHPATRTFQALRITVNSELSSLKEVIEKGFNLLDKQGRMSIITFHSLEDRIVKVAFKELKESGRGRLLNKKPIIPTDNEIKVNPRSRSAKLRLIEKI